MKRLAAAVACALAAVATASAGSDGPLLAVRWSSGGVAVARYDGTSLRPASAPLRLRMPVHVWAFAPDGRSVALAGGDVSSGAALAVVDRSTLRKRFRVALSELRVQGVSWPRANTVLVAGWTGSSTRVVALDATDGRRTGSVDIAGTIVSGEAAAGRLVLLVAPEQRIAAARLVVVDASLRARTIRLRRIAAGTRPLPASQAAGDELATRIRRPGLAVDPAGPAFVVDPEGVVAVVDLARGTVRYRTPADRQPAAVAKSLAGADVHAVWLGAGRLAVAGARYAGLDPSTRLIRTESLGLAVVDTRMWTRRVVDPGVSFFARTGRWLVATDERGVRWFDLAGRERGRVERTGTQGLDVAVAGDRALVGTFDGTPSRLIDLRTGRVVGSAPGPPPLFLSGRTSAIG